MIISDLVFFLRQVRSAQQDRVELANTVRGVETHSELLSRARRDGNVLRSDFKGRIGTLFRLNSLEVELEGVLSLVEGLVLDDAQLESIVVNLL